MSQYLTIDQGNTEAKISLWEDKELVDTVIEARLTPASVEEFVGGRRLKGAIYCSVVQNNGPVINKLSHLARCVYRLSPSTPLRQSEPGAIFPAATSSWSTQAPQ